jgi:hypothetical protein
MKRPVTIALMFVLTTAAAIAVATVAPLRRDECLNLVAQVRFENLQQYEVTANVGWLCEPKLLEQGLATMSINGSPVGSRLKVDASRRHEMSVIIARQPLPLKVCVSLDGRGADGIPVTALQCETVGSLFMDLPRPIRTDFESYPTLEPAER